MSQHVELDASVALQTLREILWEQAANQEATRRERIATAVLQGLLAGTLRPNGDAQLSSHSFATAAVSQADALIAELDKKEADGG